jgi:hypothetical protein
MPVDEWLSQDHQFRPGQRLFRSDRNFKVWAYSVSHRQLLLRSPAVDGRTRIDILFKPVEAMKVHSGYGTMIIRCATADEHHRILAATGCAKPSRRVLILQTDHDLDYVVTGAVGWTEDHGQDNDPSPLAFFPPGFDPTRLLPTESPAPPH